MTIELHSLGETKVMLPHFLAGSLDKPTAYMNVTQTQNDLNQSPSLPLPQKKTPKKRKEKKRAAFY